MKKITASILLFTFILSALISQSIRGSWSNGSYNVEISGSKIVLENRNGSKAGEYNYDLTNNGNSIKLSPVMSGSSPFSGGTYSFSVSDSYLTIGGHSFSRGRGSSSGGSGDSELSGLEIVGIVAGGIALVGTGAAAIKEHFDNKKEAKLLANMDGNWKFVCPEDGNTYASKIQNKVLYVNNGNGKTLSFEMKIDEKKCELVSKNAVNAGFSPITEGKYTIEISKDNNILTIKNKNVEYTLKRTK